MPGMSCDSSATCSVFPSLVRVTSSVEEQRRRLKFCCDGSSPRQTSRTVSSSSTWSFPCSVTAINRPVFFASNRTLPSDSASSSVPPSCGSVSSSSTEIPASELLGAAASVEVPASKTPPSRLAMSKARTALPASTGRPGGVRDPWVCAESGCCRRASVAIPWSLVTARSGPRFWRQPQTTQNTPSVISGYSPTRQERAESDTTADHRRVLRVSFWVAANRRDFAQMGACEKLAIPLAVGDKRGVHHEALRLRKRQ